MNFGIILPLTKSNQMFFRSIVDAHFCDLTNLIIRLFCRLTSEISRLLLMTGNYVFGKYAAFIFCRNVKTFYSLWLLLWIAVLICWYFWISKLYFKYHSAKSVLVSVVVLFYCIQGTNASKQVTNCLEFKNDFVYVNNTELWL